MRQPAQVLVIDDTDVVRVSLARSLAALGYQARDAPDGAAGLEAIRAERPDLVLCDMRMPVLDGLGFLEEARREFPELPVIVMSGVGLVDDAVGALRVGAWDYLSKPIAGLEVLEHAVEKALERVRLREESALSRQRLETANRALSASLRLLAEDEAAGRQLQFRMLPQSPLRFGDYEFTHALLPSAFLSGDFVDAFPLDARRFAFYLADVAGHGVSSALVTVLVRSVVRRQHELFVSGQDEAEIAPGRMLTRLNEVMSKERLDKHLTMFFAVVDTEAHVLTWANAGHFPWPLLYDGASLRTLEHASLPIGVMPATTYEQHELTLPARCSLAAVSDGLLEVLPGPSLDAKLARLRQLFGRSDVTIEHVRAALSLEARRPLPDDIAIALVRKVN